MSTVEPLPAWRPGPTRDALIAFLDAAEALPISDRVAAFDNDGTLWCERPMYVQLEFFMDALRAAVEAEPGMRERTEYSVLLDGDQAAVAEIGLQQIAVALAELFAGTSPHQFAARVRDFLHGARHRTLGLAFRQTVYQPMLELLDELRRRRFTVFIVTGGGAEFLRAVSEEFYGVPPEAVVGTAIDYEFGRRDDGRPVLRRTSRIAGRVNEGAAKVANIQTQLGRRPVLGVGNSAGDKEMVEWACSGDGPCLGLLIDHDDAIREFRYVSTSQTLAEAEPIIDVAHRLGWTVVSMTRDWETVFPADPAPAYT